VPDICKHRGTERQTDWELNRKMDIVNGGETPPSDSDDASVAAH